MWWSVLIFLMICLSILYPYVWDKRLAEKSLQGKRIALATGLAVLWFFMAFRGPSVGVDTQYYLNVYDQIREIPWERLFKETLYGEPGQYSFVLNIEPGYRLLYKLLTCVFESSQAITVVTSTIIIFLVYRFVSLKSPMMILSLWLYITLGIYQAQMNVSRNAIAIFICYISFQFVEERKLLKFILCVMIASCFHETALFFIPVYWLVNYIKLNNWRMIVLVLTSAVLGLNISFFSMWLIRYLPYRYGRYLYDQEFSPVSILVGAFGLVLFMIVWCAMDREERTSVFSELKTGSWMFVLNMCFFGINLGIEAGARMAALFGSYIICFIPQMLNLIKSEEFRKRVEVVIVLICFIQYAARLMINNIGGTMPYIFFWS